MSSGPSQTSEGFPSDKASSPSSKVKPSTYKVILLGEGGVGKTCLVEAFCDRSFHETMKTTIGAALDVKIIPVDEVGEVRLVIWDIGGEKRFSDMAPSFFIGADGALVVFDLSRPHTLHLLSDWINRFKSSLHEYVERLKSTSRNPSFVESAEAKVNNVSMIVVGNKADIRAMQSDVGQKFAEELGCKYLEASAKNFDIVNNVFVELAKLIARGRR